jgi:Spy/CpxP family protein refolding chaperone
MKASLWKLAALAIAIPAMLAAQGSRGLRAPRDWWDNPMADGLNLNDAQRKQIQTTVREFRDRLVDARAAVLKAEGDLDDVFNSDGNVDQRHANEAIDRLAASRADLTKVVSQMTLRMRGVLTTQQWQELQRRGVRGGPGRFDAKPGPDGGPAGGGPRDGSRRRFGSPGPNAPREASPPVPGNPPPVKPAVL